MESKEKKLNLLIKYYFEELIAGVLLFFIVLVGLLNIENFLWYVFGFVFFASGYFIGMQLKGFGLLFLFSHGFSGICIMNGFLIGQIFENPAMQDGATNIYIYLGIAIILIIVSFFEVIIYNLNDKFLEKKYMLFMPLITILIALVMMGILPRIFNYIYNLNIFK